MSDLLDEGRRAVLAWPGPTGPRVAPMAYWWDGRSAWMSTAGDTLKATELAQRSRCAMLIEPEEDDDGRAAMTVQGRARVFRPDDLRTAATHGGVVTAAMLALALTQAPSMVGYVADAPKVPRRWRPRSRVALRVRAASRMPVPRPLEGRGIAPALPPEVPPEIRRLLAGRRRVALAAQLADDHVIVLPAVWGAGFTLTLPLESEIADGTRVAVALDHDPRFRPTDVAGLVLHGAVRGGRLEPRRATWWRGFERGTADVRSSGPAPIVIPD